MNFEDVMRLFLKPKKEASEGGEQDGGSTAQEASGSADNGSEEAQAKPKSGFLSSSGQKKSSKKGSWRCNLHPELHTEINKLVTDTHGQRAAYKKTFNVKNAQLWVAIAQMSKRIAMLESQLTAQDQEPTEPETQAQTELELADTDTIEKKEETEEVSENQSLEVPMSRDLEVQIAEEQPAQITSENSSQLMISGQPASLTQKQAPLEQS